jgi:hypothetical protein
VTSESGGIGPRVESLDRKVSPEEAGASQLGPKDIPHDQGRHLDFARLYIALSLLVILAAVVAGAMCATWAASKSNGWTPNTFENVKDILQIVFGPLVALVSAATGFYFGSQHGIRTSEERPKKMPERAAAAEAATK